jgi:anaerobic magnesium-protoporphyrin IX monomethyl ester cyclase
LISLDQELFTVGIRLLSAYLRQSGYIVQCVFIPLEFSGKVAKGKFRHAYSDSALSQLAQLCSDSDLIGISLLTNHFMQAVQITETLHRLHLSAPIIWGGIGPTVEPDECILHADLICVGEGEDTLLELVQRLSRKQPYTDIAGLWIREGEEIIRNVDRPLRQDLDSLPLPDYSCQDHHIIVRDQIIPLTSEVLTSFQGERYRPGSKGINYPILSSRGCPFDCSYCCNSVFERMYQGQRRLRWRGTESIIQELLQTQSQLGKINTVFFVDDNFTARPLKDLQSFCAMYKQRIGLPFFCQVSPLTVSSEKIETLLDAGCVKLTMGVETANERIAALYNRSKAHAATPNAIRLIESFRDRMKYPPTFQFIIDNPYETLEETLETLNLALSLERPWNNPIYSLILFPGTPIYNKALEDGLIQNKSIQVYGRNWLEQSQPYFQLWIALYRRNIPRSLLKWMLRPALVRLFCSDSANSRI